MPRLAPSQAEEVAQLLSDRTGSRDVAFLLQRDTIYFAQGADELRSAATVLVQGVYASLPRDAHFILRNTILATREPGAFALGMVRVAARRIRTVVPSGQSPGAPAGLELREVSFAPPGLASVGSSVAGVAPRGGSHEEWLRFARSLVAAPSAELPLHARDRRVGAALVGPDGELLAASANTNGANRTLHAELNALLGLWLGARARLPRGARLYATLRPCKMCAGLLWELSEEPGTVAVYFAEDDPGTGARNTVLCPGSEMRARFARTAAQRAAPGCVLVPIGETGGTEPPRRACP